MMFFVRLLYEFGPLNRTKEKGITLRLAFVDIVSGPANTKWQRAIQHVIDENSVESPSYSFSLY